MSAWIVSQYQSRFVHDESGASLVEYAILVALIAVVAIAAVQLLGNNVETAFNDINDDLPAT